MRNLLMLLVVLAVLAVMAIAGASSAGLAFGGGGVHVACQGGSGGGCST
jgi:hypothetical protein